ncbi:MAG: cyclic nucleotide-binding domain-containing protein [Spirochaetes bacterium]|nr:cyclic nucleotide-binding domain-containing protein [Spirochaetota bacterium]
MSSFNPNPYKNEQNFFINGKEIFVKANQIIYNIYEPVNENAIFYIKSGIVKIEFPYNASKNKCEFFLKEGDIFGVPEVYADSPRLSKAICVSDAYVYVWDKNSFMLTVSMVWELSIHAIKSLSNFTKILNSIYIEKENIKYF